MKEDAWDFALETLPASALLPLAEFKAWKLPEQSFENI
jgi:hypothetical protein